jgi:hypothetical protein
MEGLKTNIKAIKAILPEFKALFLSLTLSHIYWAAHVTQGHWTSSTEQAKQASALRELFLVNAALLSRAFWLMGMFYTYAVQ